MLTNYKPGFVYFCKIFVCGAVSSGCLFETLLVVSQPRCRNPHGCGIPALLQPARNPRCRNPVLPPWCCQMQLQSNASRDSRVVGCVVEAALPQPGPCCDNPHCHNPVSALCVVNPCFDCVANLHCEAVF